MDQDVKKKYDSLPKDVKLAIDSTEAFAKIQEIGKKHTLHIDKLGSLSVIVANVMLGYLPTEDFVTEVEEVLEISIQEAIQIATEVNLEIFLPIRESLRKMQGAQEEPLKPVSQTPFYSATKPSAPLPKPPQPTFTQVNTSQKAQIPLKVSMPFSSTSTQTKVPVGMEKVAPIFKPQAPVIQPNPTTPVAPVVNQKAQIPSFEIKQGSPRPWEVTKKEIAQGFVGGKLTQAVALPTERTVITTKQPEQSQTPQKTDPYREITQ